VLAGWVANRIDPAMRRYRDNVASLVARIDAPLWGEVPFVAERRARRLAIARALDPSRLASWFPAKRFRARDKT